MELQDREVNLKLKSRPLRCAYLVRNREEVLDAITLYTHVWGGAANAILSIPSSEEEIKNFKSTLDWINPDYIFIPREGLPLQISQVLERLPALVRPISKVEIEEFVNTTQNKPLSLLTGSLSHIGVILSAIYQNPRESSKIRLIDASETFRLEIALHAGLPSQQYQNFLLKNLESSFFSQPQNIEQLLKTFLTLTKFFHLPSLTLIGATPSYDWLNSYFIKTNDEETLCLFLDDGQDLGIATAFWNCRWIVPQNKIFLPRDEFLKDIKFHALKIIEFMPCIRALYVTTPLNREEALDLYGCLKNTFLDAGRELFVKIYYRDFHFDWVLRTLSLGDTADFTRIITAEGCVRFNPSVPIGHEKTDFAFGYDAEVKFSSGRRFFNPGNLAGSHLLTNELWRLENFDKNKDNLGEIWLKRGLPVRAGTKGISGIASPRKECSFFIHADEVVITRLLKEAGFEVKPNEHTRYAKGLVKRLGGIEKVANLINDGGADIISVLTADRSDEGGLSSSKLISALIKKHGFNQKSAHEAINHKLEHLLESDLLRRSYCYVCPNCNLKNWLSLMEIKEFIECKGCAEKEQPPLDKLEFTYKPNELAAQLIREGDLAVLMTAVTLNRILPSSYHFIQFGGDFLKVENKAKFAEVDLFWLTKEALIISECKSIFIKNQENQKEAEAEIQEKIDRIKKSLGRNLEIAKLVGADAVVLGVFTNLSNISSLLNTVIDMQEVAKAQKIGLHLALNGRLHLWGSADGIGPRMIDQLESLLVDKDNSLSGEWSVGESPSSYGGSVGANGLFDKDILQRWESELREQKKCRLCVWQESMYRKKKLLRSVSNITFASYLYLALFCEMTSAPTVMLIYLWNLNLIILLAWLSLTFRMNSLKFWVVKLI